MAIPFWQIMSHMPGVDHDAAVARTRRAKLMVVARREDADASTALTVEFVDFSGAEASRDEWTALIDRALEPNIFMEPAFVLSAAQHLAEAQRPLFAMVREEQADDAGRLLAVWPLATQGALAGDFVRGWRSPYAVLGSPLIDRFRAADVVEAVLQALTKRFGPRAMLLVPQLRRTGPTHSLLVSRAMASGRVWAPLSPHARAVLRTGDGAEGALHRAQSGRSLARNRRRLEKFGTVEYRIAETPDDVREAAERFLALEERGWKGRRRTALLSHARTSTFARTMLRTFAQTGQCRIDSLELDGRPIAMVVILTGQRRAYCWKIAFDETLALYSPGVQLMVEVTRRQLADPEILHTDSCATAGDPMVERLWADRQDMVDLAIAAKPGSAAQSALGRERLRRRLRELAKRVVHTLRTSSRPAPASQATPALRATPGAPISER